MESLNSAQLPVVKAKLPVSMYIYQGVRKYLEVHIFSDLDCVRCLHRQDL